MQRIGWILAGSALVLGAQEAAPAPRVWTDVATLSFVATGGNAEGQTIGFANDFGYKWRLSAFTVKAAAIRVSTTTVARSATGTSLDDAVVTETRTRATTAESYTVQSRLDHRFREDGRFYAFGAAGWERNRPAGLENRYTTGAGVGYIWIESDRTTFRTDGGFGWTREQPLIEQPGFKGRFGTANLAALYKQKIGAASLYTAELNGTQNLSTGEDWFGVLKQALTVSLNKTLALKVGYDMAYRNRPNLIPVDVYDLSVPPVNLGQVSVEAKKLDTVFTTSLVVTF